MPGIRIDRLHIRLKGVSRAEAERVLARLPDEIRRHFDSAVLGKMPAAQIRIPGLSIDPFRTGRKGDTALLIGSALARSLTNRMRNKKGGGEQK